MGNVWKQYDKRSKIKAYTMCLKIWKEKGAQHRVVLSDNVKQTV